MKDMFEGFKGCCVVVALLVTAGLASAQAQAQVDRGQTVFADQKCTICHSVSGKGNTKGPLDGIGSELSAEEIREWIVNAPEMAAKTNKDRKPAMKAFTGIADEDLDALVAYLESLKKS